MSLKIVNIFSFLIILSAGVASAAPFVQRKKTVQAVAADAEAALEVAVESTAAKPVKPKAPKTWLVGMGMDGRLDQELNPDHPEMRYLGQIFVAYRRGPWGGLLEGTYSHQDSQNGFMSVSSQHWESRLWGRYLFQPQRLWNPYLALSWGFEINHVEMQLDTDRRSRWTQPKSVYGAAAGFEFWNLQPLVASVELRVLSLQTEPEPMLGGALRLGYGF